ncbi:transposase [Mesobacillus stamsii]
MSKGGSSRLLQDQFPELKKNYWGQHLWESSLFIRSPNCRYENSILKIT